jgi:hypothetical protein
MSIRERPNGHEASLSLQPQAASVVGTERRVERQPAKHAVENIKLSPKTAARGHLFIPRRWQRVKFIKWLRRTHAWLGLWGAVLGLLFGVTGILLNHRAQLKIPAAQTAETRLEVALPDRLPANPAALTEFLQNELSLTEPASPPRKEPAKPASWGDGKIQQPEKWQVNFVSPKRTVLAEYWVGNRYVSVRVMDPNFFARLTRLHMGTGAGVGWILLVDTLAGGLIVLALTGFLLWTRLHGPRLLALGLVGSCLSAAVIFALT